jgi:hypothetical protein
MARPLTLRGAAPQSQIANTGLMFPTLLHAADPNVQLNAALALPFQTTPCPVDHALSTWLRASAVLDNDRLTQQILQVRRSAARVDFGYVMSADRVEPAIGVAVR